MSSIRKMEVVESAAYAKYRAACADLVLLTTRLQADGIDVDVNEDVAKLRRRAGAHRAMWEAASRRLEDREHGGEGRRPSWRR